MGSTSDGRKFSLNEKLFMKYLIIQEKLPSLVTSLLIEADNGLLKVVEDPSQSIWKERLHAMGKWWSS